MIGMTPYLPEELELAAANVDDPERATHLSSTLRLKTEERQELLELVNVEERLHAVSRILNRELEMSELGSRDPVAGRQRDRQGPARVLPPPAAEGDPGGARRGRRAPGRSRRAARAIEAKNLPRRALRPRSASSRGSRSCHGGGRVRRHPHVSRLDPLLPWSADRGRPRSRARAGDPRRRTIFDLEKVKERIRRVPGGVEAEEGRARPDPLFRRPAWRTARPRSGFNRPQRSGASRAHLPWRRPRRVRDPRAPPTYIGAMPGTF